MSNTSRFTLFFLALGALWLVVSPALAGDRSISFRIDEPIVIGDQIYEKGDLVLTHLRAANLVSLRINNVHKGLLQNSGWGRRPVGSSPMLVCVRGDDGLLRLKSVQFRGTAEPRTLEITFQAVALHPGVAAVPTLTLPDPHIAVANR